NRENGEGAESPWPGGGRRLLRISQGREEVSLARTRADFRPQGCEIRYRGHEGPHPLPPGDRDLALPGGGRADHRARRQHRLDFRHRLSGLDRRRPSVHQLCRHGEIRRPRREACQEAWRSLCAAQAPAGQGGQERAAALTGPPLAAACRICGNAEGNQTFFPREMMFGWREEFEYLECGRCGCLQIARIPANLAKYYPSDGYYSYKAPKQKRVPGWLLALRHLRTRYLLGEFSFIGMLLAKGSKHQDHFDWLRGRATLDSRI